MANLELIYMPQNQIVSFTLSKPPPKMDQIVLAHNYLNKIEVDPDFYETTNHFTVDVSDNPIDCDCSLVRLIKSGLITVRGQCESPSYLFGAPINTTVDILQCRDKKVGGYRSAASGGSEKIHAILLFAIAFLAGLHLH